MALLVMIIGAALLVSAAALVDYRLAMAAAGALVLLAGIDLVRGERT